MSLKVDLQPASLWTYFMFDTLQNLSTKACLSNCYQVDLVEGKAVHEKHCLCGVAFRVRPKQGRDVKPSTILSLFLCGLIRRVFPGMGSPLFTLRGVQCYGIGSGDTSMRKNHLRCITFYVNIVKYTGARCVVHKSELR